MKKIISVLLLSLGVGTGFCQQRDALIIKTNITTLPLLMPSVALENQIKDQYSLQISAFISPWKSFAGNHLQAYMGFLEGRYYFRKFAEGWFAGPNLGVGFFDLTKWNYWDSGKYQRGYNFFIGATGGYAWKWTNQLGFEVFLTAGNSQGFYHGYEDKNGTDTRYEKSESIRNKSGEWLPYQGGIMLNYTLK